MMLQIIEYHFSSYLRENIPIILCSICPPIHTCVEVKNSGVPIESTKQGYSYNHINSPSLNSLFIFMFVLTFFYALFVTVLCSWQISLISRFQMLGKFKKKNFPSTSPSPQDNCPLSRQIEWHTNTLKNLQTYNFYTTKN